MHSDYGIRNLLRAIRIERIRVTGKEEEEEEKTKQNKTSTQWNFRIQLLYTNSSLL